MKISVILFVIISLGVLVYSNSLGNDFAWDDAGFVIKNNYIKDLRQIPFYFSSRDALADGSLAGENYRPFLPLSYAIDYFFWKLNPLGYHISNTLFHVANACLLFFITLALTKDRFISFFTALFFVTHPVQTESVTWISGRADVMFLFFYMASLIAYINFTKTKRFISYFASLFLFSCSLLSKEMAASLPFLIILYDLFYGRKEKISARATRYFGFFLILETYVILRFSIIGKLSQCGYWTGDAYTTFLSMARGIICYLRLLLFPVGLSTDYLRFPLSNSITEPQVIFSIAVIAILIAGSLKFAKRFKIMSFSVLWFFVTLGPALNIIPIRILIAERFLYLPSIGYCLLLATLVIKLPERISKAQILRYGSFCFAALLVGVYSNLTMQRNVDWSDEVALWKKNIEVFPDNDRAYLNLAVAYMVRENDIDKAYVEARKALEIAPEYSEPRMVIASYYISKGRYDDAIGELKHVIEINPNFLRAYTFLGVIYAFKGEYDLADKEYRKALAIEPGYLDARISRATLYLIKGDIYSGIEEFNVILEEPPLRQERSIYAAMYLRLGDAYFTTGNKGEAIRAWRRVYEEFTEQLWFNKISGFLIGEKSLEELLLESEKWQPDFKALCYYYVGVKKEMDRDFEGAKDYYRKSMDFSTNLFQQVRVLAAGRLALLEEK
ncbi:MAG: tetratricopeptide repeat protein [Candidatus Omnitrophica bacterium]|nr:tetratricopeptide repeat protein [Candidatus Omnitrophota bacterium]